MLVLDYMSSAPSRQGVSEVAYAVRQLRLTLLRSMRDLPEIRLGDGFFFWT